MAASFHSVQVAKVTCSHCGSQRRFAVATLTRTVLQQLYTLQCRRCGTPDSTLELALEQHSSETAFESLPAMKAE
jgi:hypothetical protein